MNYRHIYHAGNFADVMKHFILTLLLQKLREKDTPFCVLDTHAGIGIYDLTADPAQRTLEYQQGIGSLLAAPSLPEIFRPYVSIVQALNGLAPGDSSSNLTLYPGSPAIAQRFLRRQDRLLLCELHPEDFTELQYHLTGDKQVSCFFQDAYTGLKALLPPKERRGLVLIDPPFEVKNEFALLVKGIQHAYRRFATGIYAIWYPIKDRPPVDSFYAALKNAGIPKILTTEFLLYSPTTAERLNGCGMAFINPPWQLDSTLKEYLPLLLSYLGKYPQGNVTVQWLSGER